MDHVENMWDNNITEPRYDFGTQHGSCNKTNGRHLQNAFAVSFVY